jgi:hypothetical protein
MTNRMQTSEKSAIELYTLADEHSQIQRRFADLDDAILQGFASKRIIESARELERFQGCCIPKPPPSGRRDHQGATAVLKSERIYLPWKRSSTGNAAPLHP